MDEKNDEQFKLLTCGSNDGVPHLLGTAKVCPILVDSEACNEKARLFQGTEDGWWRDI